MSPKGRVHNLLMQFFNPDSSKIEVTWQRLLDQSQAGVYMGELVRHQIGGTRAIAAEENKKQEKDAQPEKIKRKIVFSDLRNPPTNFTPLFGEVAKFTTLTTNEEQYSRDGEEAERCLPQNT